MTLPPAFAIALWLAVGYTWRMAAGWLVLLGAAIGVVTVTKLAFLGWGVGVRELDFTGVSGHAMLSDGGLSRRAVPDAAADASAGSRARRSCSDSPQDGPWACRASS